MNLQKKIKLPEISLRLVLTVPFLLLIFSSVGITGYLSLRNGQKAINNLAIKLTENLANDIEHNLMIFLDKPKEIHQIIRANLDSNIIDYNDLASLEKYFWHQIKRELVPDIFFANPQGETIGIRKKIDGSITLRVKKISTGIRRYKYLLDDQGNRKQLIQSKAYDAISRPWYQDAIKTQDSTWTKIYSSANLLVPEISLVSPIYDAQGELHGIIGSEITLFQINDFLEKLKIGNSGVAFLLERNGELVASSTPEPVFDIVDGAEKRVLGQNSSNTLIQATARYLFDNVNDLQSLETRQSLQLTINGQKNIVQVNSISGIKGINFLIVVVIPESDFMTDINANKRTTLLLCVASLSITTIFGIITSSWIANSVRHLSNASIAITNGDLNQRVEVKRIKELATLSRFFNQMTEQLQKSFAALEHSNQKLESKTVLLHKTKIESEAANKAKSQFLATMSHELRTPLNAILGFTRLMDRDSNLTPKQQDNLQIINHSGEHLLSLINDILSISKIESGCMGLNATSFDLHGLVDKVYKIFKPLTDRKGLKLILEFSSKLPKYIKTDEKKLRQILLNLLSNAVKFTKEGAVTLRISLTSTMDGLFRIDCEIEDTGDGIAREEAEKLFKPFSQTRTGYKLQQGTGLGLVISQKFIELMGGSILIGSKLGQGTIVKFDFLAEPTSAAEVQNQNSDRKVIGLAPGQPEYRILVVDDRYENRELLVQLLESVGFLVSQAENGQEAIRIWETWQPHLIWMDMQMPILDGYQATKTIRSHLQGQATKIIALTASAFEEKRELILSVGCDDFVSKPFQEKIIWQKMTQYLDVSYLYEEKRSATNYSSSKSCSLEISDLKMMPIEWINRLEKAALELDEELISNLIQEIPYEHRLVSEALQDKLNNFDFGNIHDLAQSVNSI